MKQLLLLTSVVITACATVEPSSNEDLALQMQRVAQMERRIAEVEARLNLTTAQGWVPYYDEDLERYLTCVEKRETIECVKHGHAVKQANARKTLGMLADAPKEEIPKLLLMYEYLNNYGLGDPRLQTYLTLKKLHNDGRCFSAEAGAPRRSVVPALDKGVIGVVSQRVLQLNEAGAAADVMLPEEFLSKRRSLVEIMQEVSAISDHEIEHVYDATAFDIACVQGDDLHIMMKVEIEEVATGASTFLFEYKERQKLGEEPKGRGRGQ